MLVLNIIAFVFTILWGVIITVNTNEKVFGVLMLVSCGAIFLKIRALKKMYHSINANHNDDLKKYTKQFIHAVILLLTIKGIESIMKSVFGGYVIEIIIIGCLYSLLICYL